MLAIEDALCDPYGGPTTIAWLQAFSGFPRSLTALFPKSVSNGFAGAAPGENLKRMLSETKIRVNRFEKILKVIGLVKSHYVG